MMSSLDSRVLDANSEYLGVKVEELMENAGNSLADVIKEMFPEKKILFVCGTGNNGGDGFVAARLLSSDCAVFSEPKTELAKKQFERIEKTRIKDYDDRLLREYDVIVDCVLGTGLSGHVRSPYFEFIKAVNESDKIIVSCDIPSGLGADIAVKPTVTVTFHDLKDGMNTDNSGTVFIMDIGIPENASKIVGPGDMLRYPIPDPNSHKGQNGKLLIIGGGPYIGAPGMAGMAALRTGADLIHIATPESSYSEISAMSPVFIMHKLHGDHLSPDSIEELLKLSDEMDAVLIGPGLGKDPETIEAVRSFVKKCKKPMVIDADAITAMAYSRIHRDVPVIYTPHHAEFKKLAGDMKLEESASELNAVIVLKGKIDFITNGTVTRENHTGTPAMTVGGTGDVLAGTIAGLLSKGMSAMDSGCLGTYICGKAGEMAFDELSYGLVATDVITNIAKVLQKELR